MLPTTPQSNLFILARFTGAPAQQGAWWPLFSLTYSHVDLMSNWPGYFFKRINS